MRIPCKSSCFITDATGPRLVTIHGLAWQPHNGRDVHQGIQQAAHSIEHCADEFDAWQDVMGLSAEYIQRPAAEETINDPTNPKHYWRYRMHVTVEDLRADRQLLGDLQVTRHEP